MPAPASVRIAGARKHSRAYSPPPACRYGIYYATRPHQPHRPRRASHTSSRTPSRSRGSRSTTSSSPTSPSRAAAAFPTYDQVQKLGVTFTNINEKGKFQVTDSWKFPAPLKQLEELLNGREFLELIEHVTGMPHLLPDEQLVGGGLHATGARGHLDVHLDFNMLQDRQLHRRLNILVYMNKGWQADWGGEFELWDEDVKVRHEKFLPVFNRCVMFETNDVSFHGVNAVKCPRRRGPQELRRLLLHQGSPPALQRRVPRHDLQGPPRREAQGRPDARRTDEQSRRQVPPPRRGEAEEGLHGEVGRDCRVQKTRPARTERPAPVFVWATATPATAASPPVARRGEPRVRPAPGPPLIVPPPDP